MEEIEKKTIKVTFYVSDFQTINKYNSIQFETLLINPIPIDKNTIEITVNLTEEKISNGKIDEKIYLIPKSEEYAKIECIITLFCEIDNAYILDANEEGDCCLEITSMWDVDYEDYKEGTIVKEREVPDIEYNGKKLENFEKLYERKRWNLLNAKIDKFQKYLFSQQTLDYLKENRNKSYKYDILLTKENETKFLSEKTIDPKIKLIDEKEKENLKQKLVTLNSELIPLIEDMEKQTISKECEIKKEILNDFWKNNREAYNNLEDTFKLYNNRWNLKDFSDSDLQLFLLFSELQMYFQKYDDPMNIPADLRESTYPKFKELINNVNKKKSLNIIDKARIICGFSAFCSESLIETNFPELIIIEELKDEDPLKMARDKFKEVINNLNETSGLFKKLLLFDMASTQIINEWDLRDFEVIKDKYESLGYKKSTTKNAFNTFKNEFKKIKGEKANLTFPVLSMLTLKQIKKHALDLLPKYLFMLPYEYKFNAVSFASYRISFFNDTRILNNKDIKKKKLTIDEKEYVLPYMIEISHEIYSHLKTRYFDINNKSPILNRIKGRKKLLNPNDYKEESGYILENLIADDYEELMNLKRRNINLFPLTNSKYWTDINFNKMKEFNRKEMKNLILTYNNFQKDFSNMAFDKRNFNDEQIMRCVFKKFNP